MTYEVVRAYCGCPSRATMKGGGKPALDAFPAGYRTLIVRKGRKWTTVLDPYTLQKERILTRKWEQDVKPEQREKMVNATLVEVLTKRLRQLDKTPDEFLHGALEYLKSHTPYGIATELAA